MSTDRPKRETMSIEEATVSNIWEIATALKVPAAKLELLK
jgi:hypothetical protein